MIDIKFKLLKINTEIRKTVISVCMMKQLKESDRSVESNFLFICSVSQLFKHFILIFVKHASTSKISFDFNLKQLFNPT